MISEAQQHDLITEWFYDANLTGPHGIVYAGHQIRREGLLLKMLLLRPGPKDETIYTDVMISWFEVRDSANSLGFADIVYALRHLR